MLHFFFLFFANNSNKQEAPLLAPSFFQDQQFPTTQMASQLLVAAMLLLLVSAASGAVPVPCVYRVKSGDTLYMLANKYGLTLDAVKAANPQLTNYDELAIKQTLFFPCDPGWFGCGLMDVLPCTCCRKLQVQRMP